MRFPALNRRSPPVGSTPFGWLRHGWPSYLMTLCLLMSALVPGLSQAATAPGTVVTNTADISYQDADYPGVDLVVTTNSAVITVQALAVSLSLQVVPVGGIAPPPGTPSLVPAGTTPSIPVNIANNETGPLTNAVVTITPPLGTMLNLASVPGQYNVVTLPSGNLQITYLIPISAGSAITLPVTLNVPSATSLGSYTVTANLTSNGGAVDLNANALMNVILAPVATPDVAVNTPGIAVTIDVVANDTTGAPVDSTTVIIVNPPAGSTLSPDGKTLTVPGQGVWTVNPVNGAVTFTPEPGFMGVPSPISYTVEDALGNVSVPATVTLTALQATLSVVINPVTGTPGSPGVPATIPAGSPADVPVTITNSGTGSLTNAVVTVTPPVGMTLELASVPGLYNVVTLANGDLQITYLPPITAGVTVVLPAVLVVPAAMPLGNYSVASNLISNTGLVNVNAAVPLTVTVGAARTTATIVFKKWDPVLGQPVPANIYHAGGVVPEIVYLELADGDQNLDLLVAETVMMTLVDSASGDSEIVVLTETGPNTGVFLGSLPSQFNPAAASNNGTISVSQGSTLTGSYTDRFDLSDVETSVALVDPFGVLFDSKTGAPVNGAAVTMINAATGMPATVFGDDGVTPFPATVVSGSTLVVGGVTYTNPSGGYRFPFVAPGTYRFDVVPPVTHSFASVEPTLAIQALPGAPFAIVVGSRGEVFLVNPGPALHIDIPLDPKAAPLFLTKAAGKVTAGIGDVVPYVIRVENPDVANAVTTVVVNDILPPGFRYISGSTRFAGVTVADPVIAANGRDLSFTIGVLPPTTVVEISYVAKVGVNVRVGKAVNTASASGIDILAAPVASNVATATVQVKNDLFGNKAFIIGRIYVDDNDNAMHDQGESVLPGVRVFMEDGRFAITDKDGDYHFPDVGLQTHVVQVDQVTIPDAYDLVELPNNRFSGREFSQFVDMRKAGLWRANFRVKRKAPIETVVNLKQTLQSVMELSLHFNFPALGTNLTLIDTAKLKRFVKLVRSYDVDAIEIIGHTDSDRIIGAGLQRFASNQVLSEVRARVVADFLRKYLPEIKMKSWGMGDTLPVADNKTNLGKAQNRRAVIRLIGKSKKNGDRANFYSDDIDQSTLPERNICIQVTHQGKINLRNLYAHYILPDGWTYIPDTATLDGTKQQPTRSLSGWSWQLKPDVLDQIVCLRALPGGNGGVKNSIAYTDFTALQKPDLKGKTGMAVIKVEDTVAGVEEVDLTMRFNFRAMETALDRKERAALRSLARRMADMEIESIEVVGHTDSSPILGSFRKVFADNQALSEARARVVAKLLAKYTRVRVAYKGMAALEPMDSNDTAEGRFQNRRTVIKVRSKTTHHDRQMLINELTNVATAEGELSIARGSETRVLPLLMELEETRKFDLDAVVAAAKPVSAWLWPMQGDGPAIPSTSVAIQHDASYKVALFLNGEKVSALNFNVTKKNVATGGAVSLWTGVDLMEGDNKFEATITDAANKKMASVQQVAHYASPPVEAKWLKDRGHPVADASMATVVAVQLLDREGKPARERLIGKYSVDLPYLVNENLSETEPKALGSAEQSRKMDFHTGKDGIVYVQLMPTAKSGKVVLRFDLATGEEVVEAWLKPQMRDWILVGFADGTAGFNKLKGAVQPAGERDEEDGYYTDGRVAFYSKGTVKGEYLLTMAFDSAKTRESVGNSLHQTIDPNNYYTVYGDASEQQFDAASQSKLYVKLERETFYAMFGDYDTGLSVTELSRYSRRLNGIKSEYQGEQLGYNAFAAQTSQVLAKDEIRGDGSSGLYRLNRSNITINSETVRIETRARFKSEQVLTVQNLSRHVDYNIDYDNGTIFFKQPVASQDTALNPIWIVVEYEADDGGEEFTSVGGRVSVKSANGAAEMGVTYVQQGQLGKVDKLVGADLRMNLSDSLEVVAEAAQSDTALVSTKQAYKLEVQHASADIHAHAYIRQQDDAFGLGQAQGSENATRKIGADALVDITDKWSLLGEVYREQQTLTKAQRDAGTARITYQTDYGSFGLGARGVRDLDGAGNKTESRLALADASLRLSDKLSARANFEQKLGAQVNSVDFPTRTGVGLDYRITENTTLSAVQEWSVGELQSTQTTRMGIKTQMWDGARLSTNYEQQLSEDGTRAFANVGLQQNIKLDELWSADLGVDHSSTLKHPGVVGLAGATEDFTALSIGTNYHPEKWVWTNRLEYRTATSSHKWNVLTAIEGNLKPGLDASLVAQALIDRHYAGARTNQGSVALSFAWRPNYDAWVFIDKFEVVHNSSSGVVAANKEWRYINNLHANWQVSERMQMANYLGTKWTQTTINSTRYRGFAAMVGTRFTYDITRDWDISGSASILGTTGQSLPAYGASVGYSLVENMWVKVGYNFAGFYDKDFTTAEYTRRGIFMRFLYKFDEGFSARKAVDE